MDFNVDLRPGLDFAAQLRSIFGSKVSSVEDSGFWLLAAFPRSKFRLTEASVGFLLQSALGGYAAHFCPLEVQDWIYKFRVSSKSVGLFIYQKSFFQSAGFHVVF